MTLKLRVFFYIGKPCAWHTERDQNGLTERIFILDFFPQKSSYGSKIRKWTCSSEVTAAWKWPGPGSPPPDSWSKGRHSGPACPGCLLACSGCWLPACRTAFGSAWGSRPAWAAGPNLQDRSWRHCVDDKIKVAKPMLAMDSNEMARRTWPLIKEKPSCPMWTFISSILTWGSQTLTRPETRSPSTLHWPPRSTVWLSSVPPSPLMRPVRKSSS